MKTKNTTDQRHPTRIVWIIVTAVAVLTAVGVGVYGLFFAQHDKPEPTPTTTASTTQPVPKPTETPTPMTDPERFARWAASALFDWDTATTNRAEAIDRLMAVADPTGEGEGAGLVSDIGNYLPDQATWAKLRTYATRQWLDIETVTVPATWDEAKAQAAPGQLLPGTVAYTITGTRHRDGTWNGQPVTYTAPTAFTLFIACAPSFPECHLLRLSLPDQPLK